MLGHFCGKHYEIIGLKTRGIILLHLGLIDCRFYWKDRNLQIAWILDCLDSWEPLFINLAIPNYFLKIKDIWERFSKILCFMNIKMKIGQFEMFEKTGTEKWWRSVEVSFNLEYGINISQRTWNGNWVMLFPTEFLGFVLIPMIYNRIIH